VNSRQQAWLKRWLKRNYSRVWEPTNGPQTGNQTKPSWLLRLRLGLSQARVRFAQAKIRFAHIQLRLKQQLLRSKDGNGIALVEIPTSNSLLYAPNGCMLAFGWMQPSEDDSLGCINPLLDNTTEFFKFFDPGLPSSHALHEVSRSNEVALIGEAKRRS
jgi:hypothetical protein